MKILFPISKTFFAKGSFQVRHGDFIFFPLKFIPRSKAMYLIIKTPFLFLGIASASLPPGFPHFRYRSILCFAKYACGGATIPNAFQGFSSFTSQFPSDKLAYSLSEHSATSCHYLFLSVLYIL